MNNLCYGLAGLKTILTETDVNTVYTVWQSCNLFFSTCDEN